MLTCFMRSGLMVKDEIPMSYFLPLTPLMMLPKSAGCHSVLTPNLEATWLKRSTSMPCTVLMSPAFLMLSGNLLARSAFWLTETDGALPPPPASPLNELEPQALKASAATEAATTPSLIRTFICAAPSQPRSLCEPGPDFRVLHRFSQRQTWVLRTE